MYASFSNQFVQLPHYMLSLAVILFVVPALMFRKDRDDLLEHVISNAVKMVLFLILIGYLLVTIRLFEVISIVIAVLLFANIKLIRSKQHRDKVWVRTSTLFFDYMDNKYTIKRVVRDFIKEGYLRLKTGLFSFICDKYRLMAALLLLAVLGPSIYMRFYDAVMHAAPAMADAYVTLAWMKYIDKRILFHDGIYPQGFHIFLDVIYKFAAIDALYVLKYTGPLISLLTILGFYFTVSRFSNNRLAGFIAALSFGLLGELLEAGAWARQASTNSQEFAFMFVMPTLYFCCSYLREEKKRDMVTAAAGIAVIGLVHALAFVFLWLGIAAMLAADGMLSWRKLPKRVAVFTGAGILTGILSALPYGLGLLLGKKPNDSAQEYLISTKTFAPPHLEWIDYAALSCIPLLIIYTLASRKAEHARKAFLFTAWFGAGIFLVYYLGGTLTKSVLIHSRSRELWALAIPVCFGMGWAAFIRFIRLQAVPWMESVLCAVLLTASLIYYPPKPILPYKLERDSTVEQYLRISSSYMPKAWMLIYSLKEGHDLVDGKGFHLYVGGPADVSVSLLKSFDPTQSHLTYYGETEPSKNIAKDVFIFYEKNIFKVSETNAIYPLLKVEYENREEEMVELKKWIETQQQSGHPVSIFYDDPDLTVYHLHKEESKEERQRKLWR